MTHPTTTPPTTGYPPSLSTTNQIAPVPRRIRAVLNGRTVLDTTSALYVWEHPSYPQYYVPVADIDAEVLVDEHVKQKLSRGTAHRHGLTVGGVTRPGALRIYDQTAITGLAQTARFEWSALDQWYEEDEQVFVHPRDPYTRVDAIRSTRGIKIHLDGVLLADSSCPVLVFETGLPTRYYLNRTDVRYAHLTSSGTVTECPYKGTTSDYWSAQIGKHSYPDIAWAYDFPTRQLLPIAGLVAFYNEKVDVTFDGTLLNRPATQVG